MGTYDGAETSAAYPRIRVDLESPDFCSHTRSCGLMLGRIAKSLEGRFIMDDPDLEPKTVSALLPLNDEGFSDYYQSPLRADFRTQARKSLRQGFLVEQFNRLLYVPDMYVINTSKPKRSGGVMKPNYRKSIDELGGPPSKYLLPEKVTCSEHYDQWWGVFRPEVGYVSGSVVTNQQLLAYLNLRRVGELLFYNMILGHGDFLKYGIMMHLHLDLMERILSVEAPEFERVTTLMYAGYFQGGEGLIRWKRRAGFTPGVPVKAIWS